MVANIQIGLKETTQKELLKQAFEKQLSLPELISDLLDNYIATQKWQNNQASVQKLLLELVQDAPEPPMSDDEMMDFINAEIKDMRAEKRATHNL